MIEPEDYKLPTKQQEQPKPKADPKTMEYLNSLPWRPIGGEW
jgi:hypothetical protein